MSPNGINDFYQYGEDYQKGYAQGCEDTEDYYIKQLEGMIKKIKQNKGKRQTYMSTSTPNQS